MQSQQRKVRTTQAEASFWDESTTGRDHKDRGRLMRILIGEFDLAMVPSAVIRGSFRALNYFGQLGVS